MAAGGRSDRVHTFSRDDQVFRGPEQGLDGQLSRRQPLLDTVTARVAFEKELERVRRWYGCYIAGYVVMPEHVHLLISEPERSDSPS